MNMGWLLALTVVAVVAAAVVRRAGRAAEQQRAPAERRDGPVRRVEAYAFPVLGAVIVLGALVYWDRWVSIAGLAIGALFLVAGLASLRDVRRRRAG